MFNRHTVLGGFIAALIMAGVLIALNLSLSAVKLLAKTEYQTSAILLGNRWFPDELWRPEIYDDASSRAVARSEALSTQPIAYIGCLSAETADDHELQPEGEESPEDSCSGKMSDVYWSPQPMGNPTEAFFFKSANGHNKADQPATISDEMRCMSSEIGAELMDGKRWLTSNFRLSDDGQFYADAVKESLEGGTPELKMCVRIPRDLMNGVVGPELITGSDHLIQAAEVKEEPDETKE